jgi:hypothetical protein
MCVSAASARFSGTLGFAGTHGDRHLLGYQNTFVNKGRGGNAMLLHLPARPGTLRGADLLDTSDCPDILKDMASAVNPVAPASRSLPDLLGPQSAAIEIVEMGVYHIVIAHNPTDIPAALERVPESKRPTLRPELFAFYRDEFPGWPVLCCCFSNKDAEEAQPILLQYTPRDPNRLFIPALDAHTGAPPKPGAPVDVDHVVIFATDRRPADDYTQPPAQARVGSGDGFQPIFYRDSLSSALAALLPKDAIGGTLRDMKMPNGDFVVQVADLLTFGPDSTAPLPAHRATPADWRARGLVG